MSYKVYIYALMLIITMFGFSGINFNNFFKKNHQIEAKVLIMVLALAISYMASAYIIGFIEG